MGYTITQHLFDIVANGGATFGYFGMTDKYGDAMELFDMSFRAPGCCVWSFNYEIA